MPITFEQIDIERMSKECDIPLSVIQRVFRTKDHTAFANRLKTVSTRREVWEIYWETRDGSLLPLVIQRLNEIMVTKIEATDDRQKLQELYREAFEGSTAEDEVVRKLAGFFTKNT